ncbi:MAG TPA: heme lyase CcmF/NrfE family subunit [Burkholderiaceae bacterium]|nr:heme lyase CcmF/NrfE family subunit [Burkholderiaceae bacterium]
MIAELGHFALWLALAVSLVQAFAGLLGAARADGAWMRTGSNAATAQFALVATAFVALATSFVGNDFTVVNVANNSNSQLPVPYRFAASWGSHEGSLLMWALMLAGWTAAVNAFGGSLTRVFRARVIGVLGLVALGFLAFMLFTSNPFVRRFPAPPDGRDLNPLLQDPGMVIHPPMLYMGYVGFSVAFAFAIAAMLGGRVDAAWTRWARPWTTAAWCFLTMGIALGSWWAYYELGWGGWWFWDPVENASFMPWLVGTALIHSLVVTERRGAFKAWTLLLAVAAFSLSLLGTFLVRSGVLTSVHAFATDPTRGIFILAFLVAVVGGSLLLFALRGPGVTGNVAPVSFAPSSREGYLLANNVLMASAAGSVLLGTMYPLVLDTLGLGKISVGPPYFEAVFFPIMAPAAFLMGVGPIARWREAPVPELAARLKWAFGVAVAATVLIAATSGRFGGAASGDALGAVAFAIGIFLGLWLIAASVAAVADRARQVKAPTLAARLRALPGGFWGMIVAHAGVGVFCIGVAGVKTLDVEVDAALGPNQTVEVRGYVLKMLDVREVAGPNYRAVQGRVEVSRDGRRLFELLPEKRFYTTTQMVMTEAAIDTGLTRDLYVALGEQLPDGRWTLKTWVKPFVDWIWAGCFLMAIGGFVAISDRRYRSVRRSAAAAARGAGAAA